MRWTEKQVPKYGDSKVVFKFLFLPEYLNSEWRWLEFVTCSYEYRWQGWILISWNK